MFAGQKSFPSIRWSGFLAKLNLFIFLVSANHFEIDLVSLMNFWYIHHVTLRQLV